jgi:hypothetical protein
MCLHKFCTKQNQRVESSPLNLIVGFDVNSSNLKADCLTKCLTVTVTVFLFVFFFFLGIDSSLGKDFDSS